MRRIASVRLKYAYVDRETVWLIAQACFAARIEAKRLQKEAELLPVEFLIGGEQNLLLYSAKENYRVYAPELASNLRKLNLLDECLIREEAYA